MCSQHEKNSGGIRFKYIQRNLKSNQATKVLIFVSNLSVIEAQEYYNVM